MSGARRWLKPGREAALKRAGGLALTLTHLLKQGARKSRLKAG